MSGDLPSSLSERYERALRTTPPKVAATTPAIGLAGYWLDDTHFFYIAEHWDSTSSTLVKTPMILDAKARRMQKAPLIAASNACTVPALYSPDGRLAIVLKGHDLGLIERGSTQERPLTQDGVPQWSYGQESEGSLSAISYRRHPYPVGLWSPDSRFFLTHRIDDRCVPDSFLLEQGPPGQGRPTLHRFKYALPNDPIPSARLVAFDVTTGARVDFPDIDIPVMAFSSFFYRRIWFGEGRTAWLLRFDRFARQVELIHLDLGQGTGRIVFSEAARSGYIDLHPSVAGAPNVRTLNWSDEIIWFSERDGWGHLYLHDTSTGTLKNPITQGKWRVSDLLHVDEQARNVLFLACGLDANTDPARRSLCSANLDGSGFEVLVRHEADVFVPRSDPAGGAQDRADWPSYAPPGISPDGRFAVARFGNVQSGNISELIDLKTRNRFALTATTPDARALKCEKFRAVAADGATPLYGTLFFPPDFDTSRHYALIDYIYPGPQVTHQPQALGTVNSALAQSLAELGFVALMLDTRGTPAGSRDFHQGGYPELLEPQLSDHAAVVRQLIARHEYLDAERVGIIGHSAGGAAAARAMCDYGDVFKVGVAVCGCHDASAYASAWSDKYRGPGSPNQWAYQSNRQVAHKLTGRLMLIAGDMDENVPVSQTFALADALVRANRDFELLIVPNEGHMLLMTSGYVQRRVWDYLVHHLQNEIPPTDFEIRFAIEELEAFSKRLWLEMGQ